MTCSAEDAVDLPAPDGIEIAAPEGDDDLRALRRAQHVAFGSEEHAGDEARGVERLRAWLEAGALALLARDRTTGGVVGGGMATVPAAGVTEVTGIAVLASHRRRGIAGTLTAGLARAAFAAGLETVWLTPGDDGAHRVYGRAGFVDRTTAVHMSVPEDHA
jgi:predicted N-acetyltransferase YhbS